jgi:hypothetical protein
MRLTQLRTLGLIDQGARMIGVGDVLSGLRLSEASVGNPFFALELARSIQRTGWPEPYALASLCRSLGR